MLAETFGCTSETTQEESIFRYYSVRNEIDFVRERQNIPLSQRRFYIRQNVLKFLNEFAGQVPYSKISFAYRQTYLDFAGINLTSSYERAAEMAGAGSREEDELTAYRSHIKGFGQGANLIIHISPPKGWDRSFCFVSINEGYDKDLEGNKITMYPLQYEEGRYSIDRSRQLLAAIEPNLDFQTTQEFVQNPIIRTSTQPQANLELLLGVLGISEEDIIKSRKFEKAVSGQTHSWIENYIDLVIDLAQQDEVSPADLLDPQVVLTAIYNKAREIRKDIDMPQGLSFTFAAGGGVFLTSDDEFYYYACQKAVAPPGGGSCLVTKNGDRGFLSVSDISNSLEIGTSLSQVIQRSADYKNDPGLCRCSEASGPHFHCPGKNETCRHPIIVGEGTSQCPSCGEGKRC